MCGCYNFMLMIVHQLMKDSILGKEIARNVAFVQPIRR
jgi:hypothetical protein